MWEAKWKNASCWWISPTAFINCIYLNTWSSLFFLYLFTGYSSLPALDYKVHKCKTLDCFVHDCSKMGCIRAFIMFGVVLECGGEGLFLVPAFTSKAMLCCDNFNNLKLCGIWRWLYRKWILKQTFISWELNRWIKKKKESFAPRFGSQKNQRLRGVPFPSVSNSFGALISFLGNMIKGNYLHPWKFPSSPGWLDW